MNIHTQKLIVAILSMAVAVLGLYLKKVTLGECVIIYLLASINQNTIYK